MTNYDHVFLWAAGWLAFLVIVAKIVVWVDRRRARRQLERWQWRQERRCRYKNERP